MLRRMARALLSGKGQTSARVLIFCRNHLCSPHYLSFLSLLFSPFFNRQESKKPIVLWVGAIAPDSSYLCSTSFVSLKSGSEFHFVFFLFFQIINADLIIRTAARLLFSFLFFFFAFIFLESRAIRQSHVSWRLPSRLCQAASKQAVVRDYRRCRRRLASISVPALQPCRYVEHDNDGCRLRCRSHALLPGV